MCHSSVTNLHSRRIEPSGLTNSFSAACGGLAIQTLTWQTGDFFLKLFQREKQMIQYSKPRHVTYGHSFIETTMMLLSAQDWYLVTVELLLQERSGFH